MITFAFLFSWKLADTNNEVLLWSSDSGRQKYITEELTFQNTGNKELGEIILEIDGFRDNLKISDKNGINLVYLPKYEIIKRGESKGELGPDIINKVRDNKIYLL